ncbi:MAG: AAA family ATPase [Candidatus Bruticola sp.]
MKQALYLAEKLIGNINSVILNKDNTVCLAVATVLSGGNMLFEDVPGVGKTMLCRALAKSISGEFSRLQCTPDLLPSDLLGTSVYNRKTEKFVFCPGPVFTNVLLADELNRTTPKMQSALLECMEEHQTTVGGKTYSLPSPFIVVATQNPIEFEGTFRLPEAQLDRFSIKLSLGYPDQQAEADMLLQQHAVHPINTLQSVCTVNELQRASDVVRSVQVSQAICNYIVSISVATRDHEYIALGASPRASQSLYRLGQAWAMLHKRSYVIPDDIKELAPYVLSHRIIVKTNIDTKQLIEHILDSVPVP